MSRTTNEDIFMALGRIEGTIQGMDEKIDGHIADTKDGFQKQFDRDSKQDEKIRSLEDDRLKAVSAARASGGLVSFFVSAIVGLASYFGFK
jgi:hypothetical protein